MRSYGLLNRSLNRSRYLITPALSRSPYTSPIPSKLFDLDQTDVSKQARLFVFPPLCFPYVRRKQSSTAPIGPPRIAQFCAFGSSFRKISRTISPKCGDSWVPLILFSHGACLDGDSGRSFTRLISCAIGKSQIENEMKLDRTKFGLEIEANSAIFRSNAVSVLLKVFLLGYRSETES